MQISRLSAPRFSRYLRKASGGGVDIRPPPVGVRVKGREDQILTVYPKRLRRDHGNTILWWH